MMDIANNWYCHNEERKKLFGAILIEMKSLCSGMCVLNILPLLVQIIIGQGWEDTALLSAVKIYLKMDKLNVYNIFNLKSAFVGQ